MAHDHAQDHSHSASENRIGLAALLTGVFMVAEFAGGLISGSLALMADSGHMLIDFASLMFAWVAFRVTRRPADLKRTYGYDRLQVLVAFANGLILFPVAAWIIWEAGDRLLEPAPVIGGTMLWVAFGGLAVNVVAFFVLHGADKDNVNIRGALLHVIGDMLGSVGAIVAAIVIIFTGWTPIDPILSVLVSVLILGGAWRLVRDSGHILLEAAPQNFDTSEVGPVLVAQIPAVAEVHHLHLWAITEKRRVATLHACLAPDADGPDAVRKIKALLKTRFGIGHTTVEVEYGTCSDANPGCGTAGSDHDDHARVSHDHADHGHDCASHDGHSHLSRAGT